MLQSVYYVENDVDTDIGTGHFYLARKSSINVPFDLSDCHWIIPGTYEEEDDQHEL